MKLKKVIVVFLLIALFVSQLSWITLSGFVFAAENQGDGNFHYDQLDSDAKVIYNALLKMYNEGILETGNQSYDLVANGQITEEQAKEYENGSSKLTSAINAARYAFYADYPEVFYVNFQKLTIRITKGADNDYHAYLGSGRYANYYTSGFNNQDEVKKAIDEFNTKVNEIVELANNIEIEENQNKVVEQIKLVHNKIINSTGYRLESDCTEGFEGFLGTPYGALVKNQAVCEGYARSLKVILDKLGINSILVQGTHQSEGAAAVPHMWNYVEIEKETLARSSEKVWYAIDATLDDPFLRDTTIDTTDPDFVPGSDIHEGFENTRYCMVGTETMNKEHVAIETVEAAGNYTFKYPELNIEDYGIDSVTNVNGLLVKFKQEGTETAEYKAGDFYISYNNKGYAEAAKEGKYILIKYHEYLPGDDVWNEGNWGYMNPKLYVPGAFSDNGNHIYISIPNSEYIEFAVTTLAPGTGLDEFTYKGNGSDFVAQSGKLYNPSGIYKAPPYIKYQTPAPTQTFAIGHTYHVDVTYDDDLVLADGATEIGYRMESTGTTGAAESKIENFTFDGKRRITFDLTFSKMFADDNAMYRIYITGAVGKNSNKEPNYISYGAANVIGCAFRMNAAKSWNLFARPSLIENEDLSMNGWQTSDGKPVSDKLKNRIALVTTRTTQTEKETMNSLMEEQLGEQGLITSETYNISLNACKKYVVKTGHRLRLSVGFPAGYGPDDAGVTFKAYHFKRDAQGNVTEVEEIPCVVTQYGLVITCDSFSPFAIAVTENDGTAIQEKAVIVSATEGGIINGANREEGNIITLRENDSATLNVVPNDGYEIESINICGKSVEVTNKDSMDITVNYDDVKDGNCIVDAKFVAKVVTALEEEKGEKVVEPTAVPAEITMPESRNIVVGSTLKITPTVTETPGIQTYQWYKDDEKLEGKTNKVLEISNVTPEDAGNYILKVTTTAETSSEEVASTPCNVTIINSTFSTTIEKVEETEIHPGDEFTVNVNIKDFENIEKGLIALGGQLEYDSNLLEKIELKGSNNWSENPTYNEENFKFVIDNNNYVVDAGTIFTMKFRAKDTIDENTTTTIKVKNVEASNGEYDIKSNDAQIDIDVTIEEELQDSITSDLYNVNNVDKTISQISDNTTVSAFKENVEAYPGVEIVDKDGNTLGEDDIIGTDMTVKVGSLTFTTIVIGDIDGNGTITVTDIAAIKLHYIDLELLNGIQFVAGDLNNDGKISTTDIAQIKLIYISNQNNNNNNENLEDNN